MTRILLVIGMLVTIQGLQAQTIQGLQEFYKQFKSSQFQQGILFRETEIEGSPHEVSDFVLGVVVTKSDLKYENIPLRFNIYNDEMEFKSDEGTILSLSPPEFIDFIMIGEEKYIYAPYAIGNKILRGYFKVMAEGKVSLLVKQNINLKEAELPQAYKDAQPARFVRMTDDFYIRTEQSEAYPVSNKKELTGLLEDKAKEIEDYLKKNKTRFNRLEDMQKLVNYYNTLY
jgi:hypothetical protein